MWLLSAYKLGVSRNEGRIQMELVKRGFVGGFIYSITPRLTSAQHKLPSGANLSTGFGHFVLKMHHLLRSRAAQSSQSKGGKPHNSNQHGRPKNCGMAFGPRAFVGTPRVLRVLGSGLEL